MDKLFSPTENERIGSPKPTPRVREAHTEQGIAGQSEQRTTMALSRFIAVRLLLR